MKRSLWSILFCSISLSLSAQPPRSSADILHELKKLQNPTRVLYIAAHPDDENTRMISWLSNEKGVNTAYLSLTRGDGGQNLIGTELGAKLGVLRTQELMQARNIDGGRQFFSRAVDFGYSKSAEETLKKWGEDAVLSDVVWTVRKFRPDIIITRFPADGRGGHGHHTASAMLAQKAFELAARSDMFPEQLEYVDTWQAKRLYWNASNWWNKGLDTIAQNNPNYVIVDVGGYNPVIGLSNNELASMSRTQHKSQGFGVSVARGSEIEYLQYVAGDKAEGDIFDGLHQDWGRYGFKKGSRQLEKIIKNFDPAAPHKSIDALLELRAEADEIEDEKQREDFRNSIDEIVLMSLGWHAELLSASEFLQGGSEAELTLEAISRSPADVRLRSLSVGENRFDLTGGIAENETYSHRFSMDVPDDISQPYWLKSGYGNLFRVASQELVGRPENDPAIVAMLQMSVNGQLLEVKIPAVYKYSDRVEGEVIRPVFITPNVVVNPAKDNMIFVDNTPQELSLRFRFFGDEAVTVQVEAQGWQVEPAQFTIGPDENTNYAVRSLSVAPLPGSRNEHLKLQLGDGTAPYALTEIAYEHIDKRLVFDNVQVSLINLDLNTVGQRVGYIPGAGDEVAEAISRMGYEVVLLDEDMIRNQDLSQYQAIIAGIRAYNTQEWLPALKPVLLQYVENGGNYIVQYNTASRDLLSQDIGPFPFTITRNRVTEEDADPHFLIPSHPVLNTPNQLSEEDFGNWVQERGLYFAGKWHSNYRAPIGWHDEGEEMQEGALIIADSGKGAFMYTGISFFRELPAGVPGAYRLLANLISYKNPTGDEQ